MQMAFVIPIHRLFDTSGPSNKVMMILNKTSAQDVKEKEQGKEKHHLTRGQQWDDALRSTPALGLNEVPS